MRVVVLSDIHANLPALEATWEAIQKSNDVIDDIWFLGDLFGRLPYPVQVYNKLKHSIKPSVWLAGNHDLAALGDVVCLKSMEGNKPALTTINIHKDILHKKITDAIYQKPVQNYINKSDWPIKTIVAHGFPRIDPSEAVNHYDFQHAPHLDSKGMKIIKYRDEHYPDTQLWIIGHSHLPSAWIKSGEKEPWNYLINGFGQSLTGNKTLIHDPLAGNKFTFDIKLNKLSCEALMILNPGSVGQPRNGLRLRGTENFFANYLVIEVTDSDFKGTYHTVPYEPDKLLNKLEYCNYPKEIINQFSSGVERDI